MKCKTLSILSVLSAITGYVPVATISPEPEIITPKPNENFQVNVPVLLQGFSKSTH
ncbi:MAG: hypothetical protein ABSD41_09450 [Candidatus Bathyarchaeia archaeon]